MSFRCDQFLPEPQRRRAAWLVNQYCYCYSCCWVQAWSMNNGCIDTVAFLERKMTENGRQDSKFKCQRTCDRTAFKRNFHTFVGISFYFRELFCYYCLLPSPITFYQSLGLCKGCISIVHSVIKLIESNTFARHLLLRID